MPPIWVGYIPPLYCGPGTSCACAPFVMPVRPCTDVMSWMLERRLSFLLSELRRMKYFCACDATCPEPRGRHR